MFYCWSNRNTFLGQLVLKCKGVFCRMATVTGWISCRMLSAFQGRSWHKITRRKTTSVFPQLIPHNKHQIVVLERCPLSITNHKLTPGNLNITLIYLSDTEIQTSYNIAISVCFAPVMRQITGEPNIIYLQLNCNDSFYV